MHNLVWRRSAVAKARQPSIKDSELSWSKLAQPHQLSAFSGMKLSENAATLAYLKDAVLQAAARQLCVQSLCES
eukprot:5449-Heterococcus_DN1.PRE.1